MEDFRKAIKEEIRNRIAFNAFQNASKSFFSSYRFALERFPETVRRAAEVKKIREKSIGDIEHLIDKATLNLEKNGIDVFYAKTASDAKKYILKEMLRLRRRLL